MILVRCPTCGKSIDPSKVKTAPFCHQRCQQVDLYRWLSESYSVPVIDIDALEEEIAEPDDMP